MDEEMYLKAKESLAELSKFINLGYMDTVSGEERNGLFLAMTVLMDEIDLYELKNYPNGINMEKLN